MGHTAEGDAAERDAAERDAAERDAAERDAAGGDVAERDAAGGDVAERDAAGGDLAERDAAGGDLAERDAAGGDVAEGDVAEGHAGEGDAGACADDRDSGRGGGQSRGRGRSWRWGRGQGRSRGRGRDGGRGGGRGAGRGGGCKNKGDTGDSMKEPLPDLRSMTPAEIQGWKAEGDGTLYGPKKVFDALNGGAEVYLDYRFERVLIRRYQQPRRPEITLHLFDMGRATDAYGIFSHERESGPIPVGTSGEHGDGLFSRLASRAPRRPELDTLFVSGP